MSIHPSRSLVVNDSQTSFTQPITMVGVAHFFLEKNTMLRAILAVLLLSGTALAGNGAPSGSHYNLNILGKDHCAGDDLTGSNRHTIQVLLNFDDGDNTGEVFASMDKRNKILLAEGEFQVLDGNACDNDGARFQLPANPFTCPETDPECLVNEPEFANYLVYARALGKPGGSATMTTCTTVAGADEILGTADDEVACSTENVLFVRNTGKSRFENVTKELTTIVADLDGDGDLERIGIFEDDLREYFWDYDNNGLRLAQLRFYPLPE
jgi:hypothetical protein